MDAYLQPKISCHLLFSQILSTENFATLHHNYIQKTTSVLLRDACIILHTHTHTHNLQYDYTQ